MKNKQRGFIGIIAIVIIALAVIGGGAYVYTQNSVPKATVFETIPTDNPEKIVDNKMPEKATTTKVVVAPKVAVNTTVTTNNTTVTSGISGQDCGTIVDSHILFEVDKRTVAETNALKCLSKQVLSCSPAYLNVTGEDAGKYIVFNKSNENCVIGITFNEPENKKCEIPVEFISSLEKYSKEEGEPIEDLIIPLNLLIAFEKANDTRTGEVINVSCQSF